MAIENIIEKLSYSKCGCPVDYRKELGIVNGICPHHKNSVLMVNGVRMEVFQKEMKKRQLDSKQTGIV